MLALLQKDIRQQMAEKAKTGDLKAVNGSAAAAAAKRKRRWDQTAEANQTPTLPNTLEPNSHKTKHLQIDTLPEPNTLEPS
jgi:hypothetical protein